MDCVKCGTPAWEWAFVLKGHVLCIDCLCLHFPDTAKPLALYLYVRGIRQQELIEEAKAYVATKKEGT